MIARLKGTVLETTPLMVVIDTAGVGYEVRVPLTTAEKIPPVGQECRLFIHAIYREDSVALYGFHTREDRDFFRLIVERVSGIGPKIALGILSRMSVESLRNAIADSDRVLLSKCPGIGKKTAERIVIELKDHVAPGSGSVTASSNETADASNPNPRSEYRDALAGLIALGYKPADADKLLRKASDKLPKNATVEEWIRSALS